MNERIHCSTRTVSTGCHSTSVNETVQPFPKSGLRGKNGNLSLADVKKHLAGQSPAYSHVSTSITWNRDAECFEQHGCGPNFQGGVLTLCTCKHKMRASLTAGEWEDNIWIAGFTSRTIHKGKHWLFYLAKVESAHESHSDLWNSMDADSRKAKAAHRHYLGDIFKPKDPKPTGNERFRPSRYVMPKDHVHRSPGYDAWKDDINYYFSDRFGRPSLLVADPRRTFLWAEPMIFLAHHHCRDYFKWCSLEDLIDRLEATR